MALMLPTLRAAARSSASVQVRCLSSSMPDVKPNNPNLGSGPCTKHPNFSLSELAGAPLGRSHRSTLGKDKLKECIDRTRAMLEIPDTHHVGIVPASDTGAFEMAMWSLMGPRAVDCFYWESFGKGWYGDLNSHLGVETIKHEAGYGELPDLSKADPENDAVFTANGTTSGVRIPADGWDFISPERSGLTLCDATSAVFAQEMPWDLLDVTTFSWQKVLGGEGGHGVLVLGPRAVERLESYVPPRPLPKIFRLAKKDGDGNLKLDAGIFKGSTINTPSMLCVEDCIEALKWVEGVGGLEGTMARSNANLGVLADFVAANDWISFLSTDMRHCSNTSVCLTLDLSESQVKWLVKQLEHHEVAYDVGAYRDAPAGLRIWCGATVEASDLQAFTPWLGYFYEEARKQPAE